MVSEKFPANSGGKWRQYYRYFRTPDIKGGVMTLPLLMGVDSQDKGEFIVFDDLELIEL